MIEYILLFLGVVLIHELGHYLSFLLITKRRPPIKITWFGSIMIGDDKFIKKYLTIRQLAICAFVGVVVGFIPLLYLDNISFYFIYFLASIVDVTSIVQFFGAKGYKDIPLKYLDIVDNRDNRVLN